MPVRRGHCTTHCQPPCLHAASSIKRRKTGPFRRADHGETFWANDCRPWGVLRQGRVTTAMVNSGLLAQMLLISPPIGYRPCLSPARRIREIHWPGRCGLVAGITVVGGPFVLGAPGQPSTWADSLSPLRKPDWPGAFLDGGAYGRCRPSTLLAPIAADLLPGCPPLRPRQRAAPGACCLRFCVVLGNKARREEARLFCRVHPTTPLTGPPPRRSFPTCRGWIGAQPEQR